MTLHPSASGALWWQVGFSTALSGEELATEVPEQFKDEFERGQKAAHEHICHLDGSCPE